MQSSRDILFLTLKLIFTKVLMQVQMLEQQE